MQKRQEVQIVLICFDVYNGLLYRLYTLAPLPIFVCTGVLCARDASPRLLLVRTYYFLYLVRRQKHISGELRAG